MTEDYRKYVNPDTGQVSQELINHAAYQSDDVFTDWLLPAQKEERQMGQQLIMDKVEPLARIEGLKAAGINPLTAAGAVAGQASNSPQPASSVNPLGDVASAAGALATGFGGLAGGISDLVKLAPEVENIETSTAEKLAGIGLTNAETQGVLTDNTYKDEDWRTRLNVQRQQFENMKQEYKNLEATHSEIMKHIDEMISQIELNGSIEDYNNAMKLRVDEDTRWLKAKNDFCIGHNLYLNESGIAGYIFSMVESGASMDQFDDFIEIYSAFRKSEAYAISRGQYDADIDTAFDRAFNEALGDADVAAAFAPYMAEIDVIKQNAIDLYRETVSHSKGPIEFAMKFIHTLSGLLVSAVSVNEDQEKVGMDGSKPKVTPKTSDR